MYKADIKHLAIYIQGSCQTHPHKLTGKCNFRYACRVNSDYSIYARLIIAAYISALARDPRTATATEHRAEASQTPSSSKGIPDHSPPGCSFRIAAIPTFTTSTLLAYDHFNLPPWSARISLKAPSPSCKTPPSRLRPLSSVWHSSAPRTSHRKRSMSH